MLICKHCKRNELLEYLECNNCGEYIHIACVKSSSVTDMLLGDVFFIFICKDCNVSEEDYLERDKIAWVDVVLLTLYNLTKKGLDESCYGYFHCDQHIKKFVNTNWKILFPHMKTKRKSWKQMITTTLKSFTPEYFLCGDGLFEFPSGLTGWYKLAKPDMLPNCALLDRKGKKKKRKLKSEQETLDDFGEESTCSDNNTQESDQARLSTLNFFSYDNSSIQENMYSRSYVKPTPSLSEYLFAEDDKADDIDIEVTSVESDLDLKNQNISTLQNRGTKIEFSTSEGNNLDSQWNNKFDLENDFRYACSSLSLFTKNEFSNCKPWQKSFMVSGKYASVSDFKEDYIVFNLSKKLINTAKMSVADIRLLRKLKLRRLKREKNLNVFDINSVLKRSWALSKPTLEFRVLDRYLHQTVLNNNDGEKFESFKTRLLGSSEQFECFVSPFTQRVLKPFIRRDYESLPIWLKLMDELLKKVDCSSLKSSPRVPIDYTYVRPQHIPAINSLAQRYFWPGINLSECLQYPDFSCVVLYKKLIVGFAFLVPDVSVNEAYVSFIFTRPEWRKAGIGSFMLYHLIQTCMGRDITLHVSATNPAIFLYQKFGFKMEEFVQDFYEKYLPGGSRECKHAFFLRLSR